MRRTRNRALVAGVEALEGRQVPAALVVSNALDSGPGSLRQAILDANSAPEASTIDFAIPGAGVQAIALLSPLPRIAGPVAIDATTQPGYAGTPLVAIDGSQAGPGNGLYFSYYGAPSSVSGLAIERFQGDGINVVLAPIAISRDFVGLDPTGVGGGGNQGMGIRLLGGDGSVIGGQPADANVIANNVGDGVDLENASNARVTSNFIGTDAAGRADLGNGGDGVTVGYGNSNAYVGSNVIANNGGLAIRTSAYSSGLPTVIGPNVTTNNSLNLPDLAVEAAPMAVAGSTGDLRTLTYTITNRGHGPATSVHFGLISSTFQRDFDLYVPPMVFQFVGATTTLGTIDPNADLVGFDSYGLVGIDSLAPGASATVTVTIRLTNPGDDAIDASVIADQLVNSPPSGVGTPVSVTGTVDLGVTALPAPAAVPVGSPVALTFLVANRDSTYETPPNVNLALPGPDAATVVSMTTSRGTLVAVDGQPGVYAGSLVAPRPGGVYIADVVGLAPGESATVTVVLVPLRAGPVLAALVATAPENDDPNPANDLAIAGTVAGDAAPVAVSPTLTSVDLGPARGGPVRSVVLSFDGALDAARAEDVGNYRLTTGGRPIALRSATYDAATGRVTLRLARPLGARGTPVRVRLDDGPSAGLRAGDGSTPVAGGVVAVPRRAQVVAARRGRR